jgi:hypothetical protein
LVVVVVAEMRTIVTILSAKLALWFTFEPLWWRAPQNLLRLALDLSAKLTGCCWII